MDRHVYVKQMPIFCVFVLTNQERTVHSNSECLRATLRLHILLRPFNTSDLARVRSVSSLEGFQINILGSAVSGREMEHHSQCSFSLSSLYHIPFI